MSLPRNFKLLEEIENDSKHNGISYGLKEADDIELRDFTGMIIDKNGGISTFDIHCSERYPQKAPTVKLVSTDNKRVIELFNNLMLKESCDVMKDWKETSSMAEVLLYIQKKAQ